MAEPEDFENLQSGSEEVYNHVCMVCKEEEIMRKAEGYCKDCQEYLCTKCIHHHRSVRVTKAHEIIEVTDDMEEIAGRFAETTIEEDVCLDHRKAPIDMYCKDHTEVGCHHCMTLKHSKCDKEKIDTSILKFNEHALSSKLKDLHRIHSALSIAVDNKNKSDEKVIGEYKAYLEKQKAQKQILVSQIDVFHMEDGAKQANVLNEYLANSKSKKKSIANTSKTVDTLIQQSLEVQQSSNTKQKFITFNRLLKQIPHLENVLDNASVVDVPFIDAPIVVEEMQLYKRRKRDCGVVTDLYNNTKSKDLKIPFRHIILDAPQGQDIMVKNGVSTNIGTKHQCLTAMKQFENKSLEELRHEWYSEFRDQYGFIPERVSKITDRSLIGNGKCNYKLLLLGDWGVGKSTFIKRNIAGNILKDFKESLGVNVFPIKLHTTAGHLSFDVWDTCGQEMISELRDGFYKDGHCAIIMFDVSSPTSVSSVSKWYERLKQQCGYMPIVVCGNKVDIASETVKSANFAKLQKLKLPCLKIQLISGRAITNFEAPFLTLARALMSDYSMEIQTKSILYPALQPALESRDLPRGNENTDVNDNEDL